MTDPTDKRIEELWQYIPPYTAPNHPPQVKVITTTNTGDTPMTEEDPDLLAGDNLDRLRGRNLTEELENAKFRCQSIMLTMFNPLLKVPYKFCNLLPVKVITTFS